MGVSVFSQVWKVSDVYRLRADLGDADRPVLRRSPAWSEDASALYVDSLINGFPLSPMVVQSCRDAQGKSRLRVLDGWRRVEAIVAFGEDRLRLSDGFVSGIRMWRVGLIRLLFLSRMCWVMTTCWVSAWRACMVRRRNSCGIVVALWKKNVLIGG